MGVPRYVDSPGFRPIGTRDGGTLYYDGPAQLHRTGQPQDPQNVTAALIIWEEHDPHDWVPCTLRCSTRVVCCTTRYGPRIVIRITPDRKRRPFRERDMRYPFFPDADADGIIRIPAATTARQEGEWTVVFPQGPAPHRPSPVRAVASPGVGSFQLSPNDWQQWSNDLTVHELHWELPEAEEAHSP
ncbi:hypothetical protein GCM10022252_75120 [Streptosporangium oxazolinicum]|uniref:Uncharacterized protein n=1 Tax=Streptosporangium oxazolinicum TaxID=909287 RepID=A0ABP8BKT0_9ACTN